MELKDYQELTGNTGVTKYKITLYIDDKKQVVNKNKCLVLANTKEMMAVVSEDDPSVIELIGFEHSARTVCMANKLCYPNTWISRIDKAIRCEMFSTFDEETSIDMMKGSMAGFIKEESKKFEPLLEAVESL